MQFEALKVGELAKQTGLTVRTLHHYDEIGLLKPSLHTEAGHRLYTVDDIGRLQQVLSLRQLGFSLEEIRRCLDQPDFSPFEVIRLHIARLRDLMVMHRKLCDRLESLASRLQSVEKASAEDFFQAIREMNMIEKYYTREQMAQLEACRKEIGEERMAKAPQQWADLFAAVKAEMDTGTTPADPKAQELAKRWMELVTDFTGGNPGIYNSLSKMYQNEDSIGGMDVQAMRPMSEYLQQAARFAGIKHPGQ